MSTRLESDLLGPVEVPAEAWYGARTQRARQSFPLGQQRPLGSYPTLLAALVQIKLAAAQVNGRLGRLPAEKAEAIAAAAAELLAQPRPELFPVHALHGGGGVSANMNVNEVLANLAEERLGGRRGEYRLIHPNDHVNLNQSTNDVYPTAGRLAVIAQWDRLEPALARLAAAFAAKAVEFQEARRLARTCLQDAVEVTFFDFFQGYVGGLERSRERLAGAVDRLHTVNLGGTIVGRPGDVPAAYFEQIIPALRAVTGDERWQRAGNLFDAFQNPDDLAAVSAALDLLARALIKLAQDLRLLSSGPEAGLSEVVLPAVQPGSSIMPGKINPAIPEFVIQLAFKVTGLHTMCAAGVNHGELDLNIWESSMICAVLESLELLECAATVFAEQCVLGLAINRARNERNADTLIPLLTRLSLKHGYSTVTAVCREAGADTRLLRELLAARLGE
jgi:aspartate ammonia-lyase